MYKKPPQWRQIIVEPSFYKIMTIEGIQPLLKKANTQYLHWDKLRYHSLPKGVSAESFWALVKLTRQGNLERLPISNEKGQSFSIYHTKEHLKDLSFIDSNSSGAITSNEHLPNDLQKDRLIINGLIEEAISSSQIEGASTTRKVAKTMIELNQKPKNKHEQMILNNYMAMSHLEDWKNRDLSNEFLLELHKILTDQTLDNSTDEGKFRNDDDEVVVTDSVTGKILHQPPKVKEALQQLKQLYAFINLDEEENNYIHPFVKASILHFCIGYIHPFVDGNGRLARALFYWYLLKKNYWMFKFLPISLQIKKPDWKPGYYRAFREVESDEGDITYFLSYKLKLARNAIEDFIQYLQKKQNDAEKLKQQLVKNEEINQRQIEIINFLQSNANYELDLQVYKNRNKVAYETARSDLMSLANKKILQKKQYGKKYVFVRGENFPVKKK